MRPMNRLGEFWPQRGTLGNVAIVTTVAAVVAAPVLARRLSERSYRSKKRVRKAI
jgi:hypothetical protein